jgi:hypothetical protein
MSLSVPRWQFKSLLSSEYRKKVYLVAIVRSPPVHPVPL